MKTAALYPRDLFELGPQDRHWIEYTAAALETWPLADFQALALLVTAEDLRRRAPAGERT